MKKLALFSTVFLFAFLSISQNPTSINPNNSSANVSLSWSNDIPRIRYGGTGVGASSGFQIQGPGNAVKFTVTHSGNVGIGTTSPGTKLHIVDGAGFARTSTSGQGGWFVKRDITTSSGGLFFVQNGNDDYALYARGDGNVGIGTTSPEARFHLSAQDVGTKSSLAVGIIESNDAQLDLISSSEATWGSSINLIEGNGATNTDIWSIVRQTTGGAGNSSLRFNFGTGNSHVNTNMVTFNADGNIGIGTSNPQEKLHVRREDVSNSHFLDQANIFESGESRLQIVSADTDNAAAMLLLSNAPASGNNKHWNIHHTGASRSDRLEFGYGTSSQSGEFWNVDAKMTLLKDGNLGIGTTSPDELLHVQGAAIIDGRNLDSEDISYLNNTGALLVGWNRSGGHGETSFITNRGAGSVGGFSFVDIENNGTESVLMKIRGNGNVGIGTTNPDAKLTVKGTIHTEEVKVDLSVPGPDYVFEPDYDLRTLEETKEYIEENKHLPEIPSAKEMEANGIDIGEMNMLLLKKIEEMTLHQIELMERLEKAEQEITSMKKK